MEKHALDDIKVLDFGWALVGSLTTKQLADHGAQVIRIESINRLDLTRMNRQVSISKANNPDDKPWFTHYNTSKYSMSLNIKHPLVRKVLDKLIKWADVVNSNYTPGTLSKLGLDYEYIKKIKPDIIMCEGSVFGQTGPLAHEWGVDGTGAAASGYLDLTGWPDRWPVLPNSPYGDTLVPFFNAMAILSALNYKHRTGKGQYIDSSMLECCVHQITPQILDWQVNQHLEVRKGNRTNNASPHGVFPCQGDDRWCAIAAFTDEEWQYLCKAMDKPSWTKEPRFATLKARRENEDILEELISEWTSNYAAEEVMTKLQLYGVACGVVQTMEDLYNDPQMKARGAFIPLEHPVIGVFGHPTPPYKLSATPAGIRTSPCLGEHTEYICKQFLNMSDEEFVDLLNKGVFE